MLPATQLRVGNIIKHEGQLYRVVGVQHITPGNWSGLVQAKMKNLLTGSNLEHRFHSWQKFEKAFLETRTMQYLYSGPDDHVFMDTENYEQIHLTDEALGDGKFYLIPDLKIDIEYYETTPVGIELPVNVDLVITDCDPVMKGATVTSSYKPATMETGLVVNVPPYIEAGEKIRIDTRDNSFVARVE